MRKQNYYKIPKLLSSVSGEAGADRFIVRLRSGDLGMDVLPNSYPKYTGQLEEEDFVSYFRFLTSSNGKKIINLLEVQDAGKYVKL